MHKGTIKKLFRDRGFGFISDTDGRDIFFHQKSLNAVAFESLQQDQQVEYDVEKTDKGPCATNIRLMAQ